MESKVKAITGLVLGIVSIVLTVANCWTAGVFWFLGVLALACGVVGIVLAAMGMKEHPGDGLTIAALVVAIVGATFSGLMCITCNMCACLCESTATGVGATLPYLY